MENSEKKAAPSGLSRRKPRSRSSSDASLKDSYYYQNYVPLSRLPTPPPTQSNATTRHQSPELLSPGETLIPELLGPARYLTNFIPASTSLIPPSTTIVHAIITRAALPIEMLAVAASILDSLGSRFARSWRHSCPLNSPVTPPGQSPEPHIDSVYPEIVVLCSIIISVHFLDDDASTTETYAARWGCGMWSCEQINTTKRCILENIDYCLLPLCQENIIQDTLRGMERAARRSDVVLYDPSKIWRRSGGKGKGAAKGAKDTSSGELVTPTDAGAISAEPFAANADSDLQANELKN